MTELARIRNVTQPRMSQILNLNMLAPEIQEELLLLPAIDVNKPAIDEKLLRTISIEVDRAVQRQLWSEINRS
jgi:hypothetical protein